MREGGKRERENEVISHLLLVHSAVQYLDLPRESLGLFSAAFPATVAES